MEINPWDIPALAAGNAGHKKGHSPNLGYVKNDFLMIYYIHAFSRKYYNYGSDSIAFTSLAVSIVCFFNSSFCTLRVVSIHQDSIACVLFKLTYISTNLDRVNIPFVILSCLVIFTVWSLERQK